MAYSFLIPVISATAGDNEDGSLIGGVLESDFGGAFTDVRNGIILQWFLYPYSRGQIA